MSPFPQVLIRDLRIALHSLIPETKGRSLEDMDIIFGAVSAEKRREDIDQRERGMNCLSMVFLDKTLVYWYSHPPLSTQRS